MPFVKGNKIRGSRKNVPNKSTASVKAAFESAFVMLGGEDALVQWARDEPTEFYKLYAKLMPVQIQGELQVSGSLAERLNRVKNRVGHDMAAIAAINGDQ